MNEAKNIKPEESSAGRFLRGTLILTAAGIVVKVIGSLNWIFLSRVLSGEGIGIYQLAFPLYLLALSISSAGIPVAISIITAEKAATGDYSGAERVFRLSFLLMIVTGAILSLSLYFAAEWLIDYKIIRDPRAYYSLVALAPAVFFVTLLSSFRGYLQGWQVMTPTAVSQIVEQLFRVAAMLIFAVLLFPRGLAFAAGGASLGAAVGAFASLLVLLFYYCRFRRSLPRTGAVNDEPGKVIFKRIIKLALPVSLASVMLPLVANLDLLVVPLRLEAAGYPVEKATELFGYLTGMAVPLLNLATILTAALATSLVPAISRAYSLADLKDVYYRTSGAMRMANIATVPFGVMLWVLAEPVVNVVYHAPGAADATRVIAVGVFLLGVHQVSTGVLQGLGRTSIPVLNMAAAAALKVTLNWTLTARPELGIQGAAAATVADIGLAALLNMYFVHRYTGFFLQWRELGKNCLAALVMGFVMSFIYAHSLEYMAGEAVAMLLTVLAGGAVYLMVMLLCGGLKIHDLERVPLLRKYLLKKRVAA